MNGLAILEIVGEEETIGEKKILVTFGVGVRVVTDTDDVGDDGLEGSTSQWLGVAI
jgi:hypothetical protein